MTFFRKMFVPSLVFLVIVAGGAAYYFYTQAQKLKSDPKVNAAQEVDALIAEVGALIVLPEGERPTIATVSDPKRLSDQPFFAKAKAGDKVLLYSTARKAYLYDPVAKKLIEVAPLNIGGSLESSADLP